MEEYDGLSAAVQDEEDSDKDPNYDGKYENGLFEGQGCYIYPDGRGRYLGEFSRGQFHGEGALILNGGSFQVLLL